LLLDLVEHGVSREDAYRMVQRHAMHAWKDGLNFHDLVMKDDEITRRVPRKQIELAFDLKRQLRNIDKIFDRVFGISGQMPIRSKSKASAAQRRKR
jgi:adenylosuccinate lyase